MIALKTAPFISSAMKVQSVQSMKDGHHEARNRE